jgi:hypothetical protein
MVEAAQSVNKNLTSENKKEEEAISSEELLELGLQLHK